MPPTNETPDLFISYSSQDRDRVVEIARVLESAGVTLWRDVDQILGAQNFGAQIVQGIKGCKMLVLMVSAASMQSKNVKQEIQLAWELDKPYLPLLLERVEYPDQIRYWLTGWQWIEVLNHQVDRWLQPALTALRSAGVTVAGTPPGLDDTGTAPPRGAAEGGIPNPPITRINPKDGAVEIYIPAGAFTMGDADWTDTTPHKVYLSGYWIYKTPVAVAMYQKFCAETGRTMPRAPEWGWKEDHPIVNVDWQDAKAYCDWAGVVLPTEAQWEKAARGTDRRRYPWGNDFDTSRLWCSKAASGDAGSTAPVGSFPAGASPYGCLDMAGNVWEWCSDWYSGSYYKSSPIRDPTGPGVATERVLRGGSWYLNNADFFRCGCRVHNTPGGFDNGFGFRGAASANRP